MKKALSLTLILCVLITAVFFTSCGKEETEQSSAVSEASKESEASKTEEASEETSAPYVPDIYSGVDYFGKTFTVWTTSWSADSHYASEIIYNVENYDELISEGVNNAIQARNDKIYDTLGVKIDEIYYGSPTRFGSDTLRYVRDFINSSDPDISAFCICLYDCGTLSLEGSLYDLNSLENINTSNPWWEQYFNESVTIDNKLYFTIGDIGFTSMGNTPCVFYNADLVESLGLEDPVKVAIAGDWTIDKALEYSKSLCIDSASPDGMDYLDQFGWSGQYDDIYSMLFGAGVRILSPGPDGYPELTLNNETAMGTVDKIISLMTDESYMSGNDYFNVSSTPMELLIDAFEEGRCIFYSGGIYTAARFDMPDVFGILPVPKFNEEQEHYYSLLNTWTTNAYCIGANLDEEGAEFSAAVLDAMGYYSWREYPDSISTNYYGVMLKNQKLALEDSEAILDLIFEARGCEVGSIYQIGKLNGGTKAVNDVLVELISSKTPGGFASKYDTYGDIFENDLETLIDTFKANS